MRGANLLLALVLAAGCAPGSSSRARQLAGLRVEDVTGVPPGLPVMDDAEWHLAIFHVHSTNGPWEFRTRSALDTAANYSAQNARHAMRLAASRGIRIFILTDHNSLDAAFDPLLAAYAKELGVTLVVGNGWSLGGPLGINAPLWLGHGGPHASLIGYQAKTRQDLLAPTDTRAPATESVIRTLIETVHERHGVAVLSHPNAVNNDYELPMPLGFDLVEIDGPRGTLASGARKQWQRWLMRGARIGGIASSEWHVGLPHDQLFQHVNLVRTSRRTPEAVVDALRGGHVMAVSDPGKQPRVLLGADGDGDGDFGDVREGDVLVPAPGVDRMTFQVRVVGCKDSTLLVYGAASEEPMWRESCRTGEIVRAYSVALRQDQRVFVRAELWDGVRLQVVTNPLYFDAAKPAPLVLDAGLPSPEQYDVDPTDAVRYYPFPTDAGPGPSVDGAAP